jgi:hypothetical protein
MAKVTDVGAKIPEKLYLTKQYRQDTILGFMSPYGTDSAFKKRQDTQLGWAYRQVSEHTKFNYSNRWDIQHDRNELMYIQKDDQIELMEWVEDLSLPEIDLPENYQQHHKVPPTAPSCRLQKIENHELAPEILDNVPLSGYEFSKEVRRHGWNGGNVVWRVKDPRGFELEISSSNLARIIDCSVIKEGKIEEPCIWGRAGSANVLLPISSDIYKSANKRTEQTNNKVSLKDINLGDVVQLLDDGNEYEYNGKFFLLQNNYDENHSNVEIGKSYLERYVFIRIDNDWKHIIKLVSSPKVVKIVNKLDAILSKVFVERLLNDNLAKGYYNDIDSYEFNNLVCFSATKPKELKLSLEKVEFEKPVNGVIDFPKYGVHYYPDYYSFFEKDHNDNFKLLCTQDTGNISRNKKVLVSFSNDYKTISLSARITDGGRGLFGRMAAPQVNHNFEDWMLPISDEIYQLVIEINDVKVPIVRIPNRFYR